MDNSRWKNDKFKQYKMAQFAIGGEPIGRAKGIETETAFENSKTMAESETPMKEQVAVRRVRNCCNFVFSFLPEA